MTISNHPRCIQEISINTTSSEGTSSLKDTISSLHVTRKKSANSKIKQHCSRKKSLSNNYQKLKKDNCHIIGYSEYKNSELFVIKLKSKERVKCC